MPVGFKIDLDCNGLKELSGNLKDLNATFKKKHIQSIYAAGKFIIQFIRSKIPQRKSGYSNVFSRQAFIMTPDGKIHSKKPVAWMKGKQLVGGRYGKVIPENAPKYRWNKSSEPGGMPFSHPLNGAHQLKKLVFYKPESNSLVIYADPMRQNAQYKSRGWNGSEMDMNVLESGGTYQWERKYIAGYMANTISGTTVHQGDGKYIDKRKSKNSPALEVGKTIDKRTGKLRVLKRSEKQRNKSGRTQRDHQRTFKQPHVRLQKIYRWKEGVKTMKPRPFLKLGVRAFIRNQWPDIWKNIEGVQLTFDGF